MGNLGNLAKKDEYLPPRPGEKPVKREIKGIPIVVYINGVPVEMDKAEAINVMSQIVNIFGMLHDHEAKMADEEKIKIG